MANWKEVTVKAGAAAVSVIIVAAVAAADYLTAYKTAVSLLYLVPLCLAAWFSWGIVAVAAALAAGLSDSILAAVTQRQWLALAELNSAIQSATFVALTAVLIALRRAHWKLERFSRTDPLTALANSRYFAEIGAAEVDRVVRYKHPLSLIFMDMDNFKAVNDTLGHTTGDAFLREIARTVRATIRKTDTMARLGGDEFAILMPETGAEGVRLAVLRIQKSVWEIRMPDGRRPTFSIGIITNTGRPGPFDDMISAADALMYEAKRAGKNTLRTGVFA